MDDDSETVILTVITIIMWIAANVFLGISEFSTLRKIKGVRMAIFITAIILNILVFVGLFFQPMGIISSGLFLTSLIVLTIVNKMKGGKLKFIGLRSYKSLSA